MTSKKNAAVSLARAASLCAVAGIISACGGGSDDSSIQPQTTPPPPPAVPTTPTTSVRFTNVTAQSNISFTQGYVGVADLSSVPNATGGNNLPQADFQQRFASGVAAGDYDQDGDIDLFIVRGNIGPNRLYRNDGNNAFTDVAAVAGLAFTRTSTSNYSHSGPSFADIDGDGDLDLFIGSISNDPPLLFANNGDGTFTNITQGSGIDQLDARGNISSAFGDYDLDGDLDLFVTHWGTSREQQDDTQHLWRNDSTDSQVLFTSVSMEAGISVDVLGPTPFGSALGPNVDYSFSPVFTDINNDGYPDILYAGDFNTSRVFINSQDGTFVNTTDLDVIIDRNGMGQAVGDYDGDGDMDWFVSSIYSQPDAQGNRNFEVGNRLYRNDGNGVFEDVTAETGVMDGGWGWGSCFADFNADGLLDIYHTNGWINGVTNAEFSNDTSRLFIANGEGQFTDQAADAGVDDPELGRGIVCADFDNDGDVDIFQAHQDPVNAGTLWRNDANPENYLTVRLQGTAPNTEGFGARIIAQVAGMTDQVREVTIGSNFTSQNPTWQYFGLGNVSVIDELRVEWLDGQETVLSDVNTGQVLTIRHPSL
ncbi:CRTAC1 family protein [Alteromonadaceae bacterium M269]|nr:CRTAC1 family protein [Alteromonadaceae bacterium M269]